MAIYPMNRIRKSDTGQILIIYDPAPC